MSDNWIILIPESPDFVPAAEAQRCAVDLFRRIAPAADEVKTEVSDRPRFIDCGGNLERIACPDCGRELSFSWWEEVMDREAEAEFPLSPEVLPCCGRKHHIGELSYDWPQGVARFSLEAMNPGLPSLREEQIREFEVVLGSKVRMIRQHL